MKLSLAILSMNFMALFVLVAFTTSLVFRLFWHLFYPEFITDNFLKTYLRIGIPFGFFFGLSSALLGACQTTYSMRTMSQSFSHNTSLAEFHKALSKNHFFPDEVKLTWYFSRDHYPWMWNFTAEPLVLKIKDDEIEVRGHKYFLAQLEINLMHK
jgi:hypothetical protein